jgi:hypothetical protein
MCKLLLLAYIFFTLIVDVSSDPISNCNQAVNACLNRHILCIFFNRHGTKISIIHIYSIEVCQSLSISSLMLFTLHLNSVSVSASVNLCPRLSFYLSISAHLCQNMSDSIPSSSPVCPCLFCLIVSIKVGLFVHPSTVKKGYRFSRPQSGCQ